MALAAVLGVTAEDIRVRERETASCDKDLSGPRSPTGIQSLDRRLNGSRHPFGRDRILPYEFTMACQHATKYCDQGGSTLLSTIT